MKKTSMFLSLVLMLTLSFNVFAVSEPVTSVESGFSDVEFSDGFRGFCIDSTLDGAYNGDSFTPTTNTTIATNNSDGSDISQYLKILFTQHFEKIFVSDGNGAYIIDSTFADSTLQSVIWHFSDNRYIWGETKTLVNQVKEYSGEPIPDSGYTIELDNGDTVTFYFAVMQPQKSGQQHFFAYKIGINETSAHTHDFSTDWKADGDKHWHECDCGEKYGEATHNGGEADCKNPAECEICYKPYGDVDGENHTGNTEIINAKEATTEEPGYTGDTYCKDCGTLLDEGEEIPVKHTHSYDEPKSDENNHWDECECGEKVNEEPHDYDEVKFDENIHWHECECGAKSDEETHSGGVPTCDEKSKCIICNISYGDTDPDNHTGNTEIRDDREPTEFVPGYTGDTYCEDCGKKLEDGEEIPATHTHNYSEEWVADGDSHWHECECGAKSDEDTHSGGEADCKNPADCEICDKPYGNVDEGNHTGNTEIRNDKEATTEEHGYTGDTYCKDCDELLEEGEDVPQINDDGSSDDNSSDNNDSSEGNNSSDKDNSIDSDSAESDKSDSENNENIDDNTSDDDKNATNESTDGNISNNSSDSESSTGAAKTGDESIVIYMVLLVFGLAGLVSISLYKKKNYLYS